MKGILGRKVGMTQIFDESGKVIPVTVLEAGPCFVTQIRTKRNDGYQAVQLGFGEVSPNRVTRAERGHLEKAKVPALRHLRELRVDDVSSYQEGQRLDVSQFEVGDRVDVIGVTKGRGFAGVVKRHGFHGGPKTHGQSDRLRAPGSIGAGTTPGHVIKGMRMPGRMGNQRVTIQNLKVVLVDPDRNLMAVRGAVPGASGGDVIIHEATKRRKGE